jgi:hypothetical protein
MMSAGWCRRPIGLLLLCFLAVGARAQVATVNGFVADRTDGQPLELVNIVLLDEGELVKGTVTDLDGLYLLSRIQPGQYVLRATFIGYETFADTLDLEPGGTHTVNIALGPTEGRLDELVVQTERESGAARVTAGQQTIRPADIELIPAPDVSGDLVAYLTTLPGIVSTGDRGGQLFIRGGEPSQNLVQLDGMMLYQPLGFYSGFPADILSRADIYAGGYGARFGERISSVIDVWTRTGNKRRFAGATSICPFVGTLRLEGPIIPNSVSFLVSARKSMIEHGAEPLLDERMPFDFSDVFGKIHADVTRRGRLSVSGITTRDRGTLVEESLERPEEEVRWKNTAVGMRYLHLPTFLPLSADLRVTHSRLDTEMGIVETPDRTSSISNTTISLDGTFSGNRTSAEAGFALRFISSETELAGLFQNTEFKGVGIDHIA